MPLLRAGPRVVVVVAAAASSASGWERACPGAPGVRPAATAKRRTGGSGGTPSQTRGGASFNPPPPHPRPAWPRLRRERRRQWTHHFLRRHAVVRYMPGTFKDPTPRPRGMPRIGGGTRQTHRRARDGSKQFYSVRKQALRIAYPASRTRGYAHCHRGDSNHSTAYLASRYGRGDSATGASTRDRRRTRAGGRGRGGDRSGAGLVSKAVCSSWSTSACPPDNEQAMGQDSPSLSLSLAQLLHRQPA